MATEYKLLACYPKILWVEIYTEGLEGSPGVTRLYAKDGVFIEEHSAKGDGDIWSWTVHFPGEGAIRYFRSGSAVHSVARVGYETPEIS